MKESKHGIWSEKNERRPRNKHEEISFKLIPSCSTLWVYLTPCRVRSTLASSLPERSARAMSATMPASTTTTVPATMWTRMHRRLPRQPKSGTRTPPGCRWRASVAVVDEKENKKNEISRGKKKTRR